MAFGCLKYRRKGKLTFCANTKDLIEALGSRN